MAPKDKTVREISDEEKVRIDQELQAWQLEETRDRVLASRAKKHQRNAAAEQYERGMKQNQIKQKMREDSCPHRKGGKNMAGLLKGNDANHSIVRHTLPLGEIMVLCQRCFKIWRRPDRKLLKGDAAAKAKYMDLLAQYRTALEFPTDNEDSGTQIFMAYSTEEEESAA
jgi:hypothetical protein